MTKSERIETIDRLLREGKTNEEIAAAVGLASTHGLFKVIQRAGWTIESHEVIQRVAGRTASTTVVSRRLVEREAAR